MKNKKLKKIFLVLLVIIVFVVGIIVGRVFAKGKIGNNTDEATEETQIVNVQVGTQTIENTLTSSGEVSYSDTEKLTLSTSKYFKTMCVESGDIVKAGENILEYTNGTYLTAEYDCIVNSYSVPDASSKCTSSNYVEVENIATMTMTLSINESEINKVAKGQEVDITLSALDDTDYTGTIKSVSSIGTYQSSGTTFSAVVEFENDGNVKPGMSASCSIVLEKAENCVAVPIEAVQTNNEQKYVVIVNDDGSTKNVDIETGISNDSYVEVTSGLSGGETIQMVQIVTTNSNDKGGMGGQGGQGEMPDMSDMKDMGSQGGGEMPSMGDMPQQGN